MMRFRTFGNLDWKPSALGFGAMRLSTINGDHSVIDEPLAQEMVRTAIDSGTNCIDTVRSSWRLECVARPWTARRSSL